ncbi:conserved hypothetical protein [Candidatus Terasakiella magnetica]|uniref:Exonuclease domain-containing protein n=1 Tax=Candidatus Terasakiella magnetica TaxID=1867952 RepID=A0A1C3RCL5_9PROT|nr:hypothetical protein [Candidatus Terasakiella magnetica]SCA55019.1 conserved hypothetical protein [Candidatus Terasakiella magnetica]
MNNNASYPRFIDFEASGFGEDSYPIEVAWNNADGSVESMLLHVSSIASWTHWDDTAEKDAHQISREELDHLGEPIKLVAQKMNIALKGGVIYSDAPQFDGFWLARLFEAANERPAFRMASAVELFDLHVADDDRENDDGSTVHKMARFDRIMDTFGLQAWANLNLRPHRASHDVRHLMETYRLLLSTEGKIPAE